MNTVRDALAAVERAQSGRLRYRPGTRHLYLNAGFTILGRVVELASGEDYYAYVDRHVFQPAGMSHTGWFRADRPLPDRASYWYRADDTDARPWRQGGGSPTDLRGNAETGAWSTALDLWRFAEALRRGTLVSPATVRALWSPKPELEAPEWGYGFAVTSAPGVGRVVGHGGTGGPVSACLDLFVDAGITVVVLSNTPAGRTSPRAKVRALFAAPGRPAVRDAPGGGRVRDTP
jgi:CubicO group peptidase (beta-lactamase class C family)